MRAVGGEGILDALDEQIDQSEEPGDSYNPFDLKCETNDSIKVEIEAS